jgi:2-hydroxychromene-2-carboxylate isomerase
LTTVEFFFEFASTYSYPAAARIGEHAALHGISIAWRPFLLGPIFKARGWNDSPFNLHPAKGHYMWRDLERVCAALELPFRRPSVFPRNGLLAARLVCLVQDEPWVSDLVRAIYAENFAADHDISDRIVLGEILETLDRPRELLDAAQSPAAKDRLRSQTERAAALGIFGAPSFVVGSELFWGNDRLEDALAWAWRENREASAG